MRINNKLTQEILEDSPTIQIRLQVKVAVKAIVKKEILNNKIEKIVYYLNNNLIKMLLRVTDLVRI